MELNPETVPPGGAGTWVKQATPPAPARPEQICI